MGPGRGRRPPPSTTSHPAAPARIRSFFFLLPEGSKPSTAAVRILPLQAVYLDSSYRRRGAAPTSDPKFRAQGGKMWAGSSPSPAFMPGRTASLSRRRHEGDYPLPLLACSIPPTSIDRALFHGPGDSDKLSLPRIGEERRHPPAGAKPPKSRRTAPPPHLSDIRDR